MARDRFGIDTFGIGEDTGQPVTIEYKAPWPWSVDRERWGQLLY
jgi:arylsulfatase